MNVLINETQTMIYFLKINKFNTTMSLNLIENFNVMHLNLHMSN